MTSLRYRGDIDGLRALAVIGVVIYHAFPRVMPGGFSGVDIFFVISGYLISGILYKGQREENFRFGEFYARRVRRLFPSLITMLVLCMMLGYRLLLANEFEELGRQVAAGALFVQNFLFWQESGYFDRAAELKPLLHLWSLAVEEQFYLVFPLLLILLWKKNRWMVPALAALFAGSLTGNCFMAIQNPGSDFYMIPYRAWEFLGGSLLAWWHDDRQHDEQIPPYRELMSWAGLCLLAAGMTLLHQGDPYPGWRALLPVMGTLLLMEGGSDAWVNRKILSHPAVVWVGLISYPLYLFHWPLLSFVHITQGGAPDFRMTCLALGIALLLTVATYYLIERRVRFSASRWTVPVLSGLFLAVGLAGFLCYQGFLKPRSSRLGFDEIIRASEDNDYFKQYERRVVTSYYSLYKAGGKGPKTLFLGDSHMEQCAPRILEILRSGRCGNRGAVFLTKGGAPPISGVFNSQKDQGKWFTDEILRLGVSPDVDRVVIAANWCYYFNWGGEIYQIHDHPLRSPEGREEAFSSLAGMISSLRQQGRQVCVLLSFPTSGEADPLAMVRRSLTGDFSIREYHFSAKDFLGQKGLMPFTQGELMERLEGVVIAAGAQVIRPMDALQKGGEFPWHDGRTPYYHDGSHYTASFMRRNAGFLDPVFTGQDSHPDAHP